MARLDYYAIEQEIKTILDGASDLAGTVVTVEDDLTFDMGVAPWIGIYLEGRSSPQGEQRLSAGQRTDFILTFRIWCWTYSMESIAKAIQLRDDLVGKVEIVLMGNRTINGIVSTSWLDGGEMPSARLPGDSGFASGAEITLVARATATTN